MLATGYQLVYLIAKYRRDVVVPGGMFTTDNNVDIAADYGVDSPSTTHNTTNHIPRAVVVVVHSSSSRNSKVNRAFV